MTTTAPETVTIRGTEYTVEREFEEGAVTDQLGWLHGKRGSLTMIVRSRTTGNIVLMASAHSILNRLPVRESTAVLAPLFDEAQ